MDIDIEKVDTQELAHVACMGLAKIYRREHPEQKLTIEQAYAKVYSESETLQRARAGGALRNFAKLAAPVARTEPIHAYGNSNDTGLAELKSLAAEQRRRAPWMTIEQAFAAVYEDPANGDLVASERAAARERMYGGGARVVAS